MNARKPEGTLRRGWTTGSCAAAAAAAALRALLSGHFPTKITIELPRGQQPTFPVFKSKMENNIACASIIKDAGDDPDVTHGAEIIAEVRTGELGTGVTFEAGEGVGTVTLPGLPLRIGEPAINPAPRQIIAYNLKKISMEFNTDVDLVVRISIPRGKALAEKTMNGRLGIQGGLSILGTTGVVIPFSCASWIHSIHRGIDVARANGVEHIAAATGSTSENAVRNQLQIKDIALIDMGDFAGGMLKYLRTHPISRLTIAGGFAKLTKLAQGHMDLHSARSSVNFNQLAETLKVAGASAESIKAARQANTALAVLDIATNANLPLADHIAARARETVRAVLSGGTEVEVFVYDRQGTWIGHAG